MAPRAQGADPSTAHLFMYPFSTYAVGYCRISWVVLGLRAPPVVTSASEVLTQTYRSSGLVRCWALKTQRSVKSKIT